MLSVAKVNTSNCEQLCQCFVENYGAQASYQIIITDFNNLKELKEKPVQELFVKVGDISDNYNVKKPNDKILGPVPEEMEREEDANAAWLALPAAQQRVAHEQTMQTICS